jgi:hypothetical protein
MVLIVKLLMDEILHGFSIFNSEEVFSSTKFKIK